MVAHVLVNKTTYMHVSSLRSLSHAASAAPRQAASKPVGPAKTSRALVFLTLALVAMITVGCEDPNKIFGGTWRSWQLPNRTLYNGSPVLMVGHYGQEVAGLIRFHRAPGASALDQECPCGYIERGVANVDTLRVKFTTGCAGNPDAPKVDWSLYIFDDADERFLKGEVMASDGQGDAEEVELKLDEDSPIRAEDKECDQFDN